MKKKKLIKFTKDELKTISDLLFAGIINGKIKIKDVINFFEGDDMKKVKESEFFGKQSFWLSIKKAEKCLFSRRNGFVGKIILGYSICLRLFNYNIF